MSVTLADGTERKSPSCKPMECKKGWAIASGDTSSAFEIERLRQAASNDAAIIKRCAEEMLRVADELRDMASRGGVR